ncbi:MAG: hypothetical protein U0736_14410 [Gemmataceae bacterium]
MPKRRPHRAPAELPPLIPRKVLFGNLTKRGAADLPDGTRLSYLPPDDKNVLQVWVQTLGKDDAKQVTHDKKRGIRTHPWTYAPDTLLYLQDNDGDAEFSRSCRQRRRRQRAAT